MAADIASMSLQKAEGTAAEGKQLGNLGYHWAADFSAPCFKHNRMDEAQAAMNEARDICAD